MLNTDFGLPMSRVIYAMELLEGKCFRDRLRLFTKKTAAEISRDTGIAQNTISGWCRAESIPSKPLLLILRRRYNISPSDMDYLQFGEGLPPAKEGRGGGG